MALNFRQVIGQNEAIPAYNSIAIFQSTGATQKHPVAGHKLGIYAKKNVFCNRGWASILMSS